MPFVSNLFREFYPGRRVLVTGNTGFKGSWLSLWLQQLGADVCGYALDAPNDYDLGNDLRFPPGLQHHTADLRDAAKLDQVIQQFQPQTVFHLAAQPLVRYSYDAPVETFDVNVRGSLHVLESVRHCASVESLVFVTSDKCYKNREWIWGYRESDELGGADPYSASKAAAEILFASYQDSFFRAKKGFGAASARAGNVIGGGDWAKDRIVPDCIRALRDGQPIFLRRPSAVRPWQHVLEPLAGYLLLGVRLAQQPDIYRGAWNFGPDKESIRTVQQLAEQVIDVWGSGRIDAAEEPDGPHETTLLSLSCEKAIHQLGWRPRWDFARAVKETTRWYRQRQDGVTALALCTLQIEAFMKEDSHD